LESEKEERIFDIIIYGSLAKGKEEARDVDILAIFLEGTLRERLDRIQEIKQKIKKITDKEIDIKQIMLRELFSAEFLARTAILTEGISAFNNKKFCETLGLKSYTLFWYDLKGLSHTQKVKFNYILSGRNTLQGIIKEFSGERIASGAIKIPTQHTLEFEEILKNNKVNYKKKEILEPY
jgi:predicted nucleotidyltransferase